VIRRRLRNASTTHRTRSRRLFLEGLEDRSLLASVVTDKPDYNAGETALISATGYQPGETVRFQVVHIDGTPNTGSGHDPWNVQDGSAADLDGLVNGNIRTSWYVHPDDSAGAVFELSALGLSSGSYALYNFTDAGPPSVDQLFQWDPPGWVTGNNDGPYFEGDTVPYYTSLSNLVVGTTYSLKIEWDTTKSSKHAIDYLRSYDATIAFPPAVDPAVQAGVNVVTTDTIPIPTDTFMTSNPDFVANGGVQQPGVFKIYNGDLTAVSAYTNPPNYTDDTSTSITVFFVAQDDGVGDATTRVVLTWGGHIASRQDWGELNSAVSIPGSPYHMRLEAFRDETNDDDLNVGNTDRSLSAAAVIFPATITVVKDAIPNDAQDFAFTTTGSGLSNFTLDDDADPTLSNTIVFNNITTFGTKTITEGLVSGWNLTDIQIVESGGMNDSTFNLANRLATLNVQEGENITVTYTNTRAATVTLVKNSIGGDATFDFDGTGGLPADVDLTTVGGTASQVFTFNTLPTGGQAASITELLANLPAGWNFTSLQVTGDDDAIISNQTATLNIEPGENIVVTYTNTRQATVRVVKNTIGGDATFQYDVAGQLNGQGSPAVPDPLSITTAGGTGQSALFTFSNLPAGGQSLSFDELALAGWSFTSIVVSGDAGHSIVGDLATLDVDPGETIVVTYTNTKDATVRVVKNAVGGNATFQYDVGGALNGQGTPAVPDPLSITTVGGTGQSALFTFSNLPAGGQSLSFDELALAGWSFTSVVVSGDAGHSIVGDLATLDVDPGETIVVTYTNTKDATVRVVKNTIGGDATFQYDVGGALNGQGTPAVPDPLSITTAGGTGQSALFTFSNLPAAGQSLIFDELALAGWTFTSVQVSGDAGSSTVGDVATLDVDPGETIVVTYTNTKDATVRVVKNTIGGDATFQFDTSGQLNGLGTPTVPDPLSITTAGGTGQSALFTFSNLPAAGQSLIFDELALAGWTFVTVQVSGDAGSSTVGDVATLDVDPGENIIVTFTNSRQASITIVKNSIGGNDTFDFDGTGLLPADIDLTTVGGTGSQTFTFDVPVGGSAASVTELLANLPAGWTFTSLQVAGDDDAVVSNQTATLNLEPGENITVTYTNTRQATVRVVKNTIGGDATFQYDVGGALNGQGSPAVPDPLSITTAGGTGQSALFTFSNLPAAGQSLSFDELALAGWSFTSLVVNGDAGYSIVGDVATLDVDPGETIVVTYTNTKNATVRVVKNTIGGNATFQYDVGGALNGQGTPAVPDPLSITTVGGTGQSSLFTFSNLPAAGQSLSFDELALAGWSFTSVEVSGDAGHSIVGDVATLDVDPGEEIVVTYTNTKEATVRVVKNAIGGDGTFDFDVGGALNGQGSPAVPDPLSITTVGGTGQSDLFTFANLPAAGSSLSFDEIVPSGWSFTSLVISGGDADDTSAGTLASLNVEPGEEIVVTYTNTKKPTNIIIAPDKQNCSLPYIHIVNSETGEVLVRFKAYDESKPDDQSYLGGVRVATGDLTGDGIAEIVTVPGRGYQPLVRIWDQQGNKLKEFLAYSSTFVGGVDIAVGDIDGNGFNDIATAMNYNGNEVKVFKNTLAVPAAIPTFSTFTSALYPFGSSYKGGATIELADMGTPVTISSIKQLDPTLDGKAELIIGSETGMAPTIKIFSYFGAATTPSLVRTMNPFTPTFHGGMSLDVARINPDPIPDIIVGAGNGGASQVQILDGLTGAVIGGFTAFTAPPSNNAPVDVAALDQTGDGIADVIFAVQGSDGDVREVRMFDAQSGALLSAVPETSSDFCGAYFVATIDDRPLPTFTVEFASTGRMTRLLPYGPTYFGGIRVATGDLNGDGIEEIVTGPERNYAPWVRVFDQSGNLLHQFLAYSSSYKGGVDVAVGDVNGDGKLDIATSMLYGGNQVKTFKNVIPLGAATLPGTSFSSHSSFYPFGSSFKGGAVVEMADMGKPVTVSGVKKLDSTQLDGKVEVVVANGSGLRSTVKAYTYFGTSTTATLVRTFLPLDTAFRGGLSLDLGDVNGDLVPDVFVGAGKGGASQVQVLNGVTGGVLSSFQAFGADEFNYNAKLEVEAQDIDLDGIVDFLLAAHDFDGKSREVRRFLPLTGELVDAFFQDYSKL
jgi:uncharacterized protein YndB with AHSA1/START domain